MLYTQISLQLVDFSFLYIIFVTSGNLERSVQVACGIFKRAIGCARQGIMFITWRVSRAQFVPDS